MSHFRVLNQTGMCYWFKTESLLSLPDDFEKN